ncbi:MAG: hypothetical protein ACK41D_04055 [Rubricoccaceae bacterium]
MRTTTLRAVTAAALVAGAFLTVSGCDSTGADDAAFSQRLLVAEHGEARLHVMDLGAGAPMATLNLAGPIRAYVVATGESNRYAFLAPTNGPIQAIDGGIFRQGGRLVEQAPALLPFNVPGENLVHLTLGGSWVAGFYDGTGEARLFDGARVGSGNPPVTTIASGRAHHGVAVAVGDLALVTRPVEGQTLPNGVRAYNIATGALVADPEATCPGLHGEAKGANRVVAFGCSDGLLVVRPQAAGVSAVKVPFPAGVNPPLRVGTLHAHESVPSIVAHVGGGGQNVGPAILDPATNTMRMLEVPGRPPYALGYRFSTDGRHFLVLGLDGTLHIYDAGTMTLRGSVTGAAQPMPDPLPTSGAVFPQVIATARHAYVSDPATNQVREIELATRRVTRTMTLPFRPGVLALVGPDGPSGPA